MNGLETYRVQAANWRELIRRNKRRTRWVIFLFILIYTMVGALVDVLFYQMIYPHSPLQLIIKALLTFEIFPYGTLSMALVAMVALWVTYMWYDKIMLLGTTYHQVTGDSTVLPEKQLYNVVEEMKVAAGLNFMPKVYIIEASYMNAFASGFSEKSAMVAITRGLLEKLDRSEMQAVMAHELSHIQHQDIKLTLMASVLSNIMLIVVDLLYYQLFFDRRRRVDPRIFFVILALRYVLPTITVLLMLYLSRTREFMADAGCVQLMRDNQPLARALLKINQDHQANIATYRTAYTNTANEDVRRAAYLYDPEEIGAKPLHSLSSFFSTHPNLDDRLKAIGIEEVSSLKP